MERTVSVAGIPLMAEEYPKHMVKIHLLHGPVAVRIIILRNDDLSSVQDGERPLSTSTFHRSKVHRGRSAIESNAVIGVALASVAHWISMGMGNECLS